MSDGGRSRAITRADTSIVSDRYLVPDANKNRKMVLGAVAEWPDFAKQAGVPAAETERIAVEIAERTELLRR